MTIEEAKAKLVDLAKSQVGYREGASNYTKYADEPMITRLYGWCPQNQPWCCTFVNWCFLTFFGYDLGSKLTYGGTAACASSAQLYQSVGAFVKIPQVGDQAFYFSGGGINHTGLVVEVDGTSFVAIEGNYSDKVSTVRHNTGASDVAGFGRPNWELLQSTEVTDEKEPVSSGNKEKLDLNSHIWKPQNLKYGATGIDVYVLQGILVAKKFYADNNKREIDGEFGAKTQAAVNNAKRFYGQMANGEADINLWRRLLETG
jgi:hypothetical protein